MVRTHPLQPCSNFSNGETSCHGFLLLGVLIEKVSGKSCHEFVAEHIYNVAGMTDSGSEPESVEVANRSKGYMRDRFEMVSNEPTLPWRGHALEVNKSVCSIDLVLS